MEDLSAIRERIQGRYVLSANGSTLLLDDGTVLTLYMSDSDCCAHAEGEWVVQPDSLEAIITDVKIEPADGDSEYGEVENRATVTILHNQNPVALADCSAGHNGYYFAVLSLEVSFPGLEPVVTEVVSA